MSRRQQNTNRIRGPQSALTDFLASNNISAVQIRDSFEQRRQAAEQRAQQEAAQNVESGKENDPVEVDNDDDDDGERVETPEEKKKRKRKEKAAIEKIKQSKEFKRRKANTAGEPDADDDYIAFDMLNQKSKPLPGQLENCEVCGKRFTVTPYSKTGPDGGLLCTKCSKELRDEEKKNNKPKQKAVPKQKRRQNQSNLLDGLAQAGAKSLVEYCVERVADNINQIDEFGDLPPALLNRLSQILSKRRVITARTLDLFLRPDLDSIAVYDCARLEDDEYAKIFSVMSNVEDVNLRNAGRLKDELLEYMIDKKIPLKHLQLVGSNLVSDDGWRKLFSHYGPQLLSLKLGWLDNSFDDETVKHLVDKCPNIKRLKLKKCWKTTDSAIHSLAHFQNLEHLSLDLPPGTEERELLYLVDKAGSNLKTLSLETFTEATDDFLAVVHQRCNKLAKLRFISNANCTDRGFVELFTSWLNPPLTFVDLSSNRDVDNSNPDGPEQPIGLGSEGFTALMQHSGSTLEHLDISSCRHISYAAFADVFDGTKQYPELTDLNISFLTTADDFLVGSIFKSCPKLAKLTAFACFKVKDVRVPVGVALIGVPNAQDSIVVQGDYRDMGELPDADEVFQ